MGAERDFDPEPILRALTGSASAAASRPAFSQLRSTGADAPLTREVLVRRADRKFATPHGELHLLHEVPGVADFRDFARRSSSASASTMSQSRTWRTCAT
jgi:hypothetical protein